MRRLPNGLRWREGESENEVPRVFLGGGQMESRTMEKT